MWFLQKKKETPKIDFNRRKFERVSSILTILSSKAGEGENFRIFTENIGLGGIRFNTSHMLKKGDKLKMTFLFKSFHGQLIIQGEVKWVNPLGTQQYCGGIEFVNVDENLRMAITQYIQKNTTGVVGEFDWIQP